MSRINTTVNPNNLYCCSALDLYSQGVGRNTGYPVAVRSFPQFRQEKTGIVR
jgi:hypothetical protein